MNIREYIESGVLEQYCLGVLPGENMQEVDLLCDRYPELAAERRSIEQALLRRAEELAVPPPAPLQDQIWHLLNNLNKEKQFNLSDLPLINRFSDYKNWLRIVQPLLPPKQEEDRILTVLQQTDKLVQMLVLSKTDFRNEVHVHEYESFIILEGECECTIGDHVFRLGPGGFTEIPLYTDHDVRIITPVTAILQRIAV